MRLPNHLRTSTTVSLIVASAVFSGCWSSKKEVGPTEVVDKAIITSETPEEELLDEAKSHYERKLYSSAAKSFEALATSYPLGAYGSYAQLKLGDSHYQQGAYPEAAQVFESFVSEHPGHSSIAYALYMAGVSNLKANSGIGRDMEPVEKSKQHFENLLNDHGDSPYALEARNKLNETEEVLARHDEQIMKFYKKSDLDPAYKERAAAHRKQVAVLGTLKRRAKQTELIGRASLHQRPVVASYRPNSRLVPNSGLAIGHRHSGRARLGAIDSGSTSATSPKSARHLAAVESVACKGDGLPTVVLEFDRSISPSLLRTLAKENSEIISKAGLLTVELPGVDTSNISESCFSNSRISSGSNQDLLISGNFSGAVALPMNDPPRLALVLQ
jgi:outer membrane assembly lipoprotein YfiO